MWKEERKKAQEVKKEALWDEYKMDMGVWEKCAALQARRSRRTKGRSVRNLTFPLVSTRRVVTSAHWVMGLIDDVGSA
jgi:hypothetical protein